MRKGALIALAAAVAVGVAASWFAVADALAKVGVRNALVVWTPVADAQSYLLEGWSPKGRERAHVRGRPREDGNLEARAAILNAGGMTAVVVSAVDVEGRESSPSNLVVVEVSTTSTTEPPFDCEALDADADGDVDAIDGLAVLRAAVGGECLR